MISISHKCNNKGDKMKDKYCVNCKYHEELGFYGSNYCVRENSGRMNEVTGEREFDCKDLCARVRNMECRGNWFEPKKSFITKLICLFKGE